MFYAYVLQSVKEDKWYTGYTDYLRKRLEELNRSYL